jgi:hypothetical protein
MNEDYTFTDALSPHLRGGRDRFSMLHSHATSCQHLWMWPAVLAVALQLSVALVCAPAMLSEHDCKLCPMPLGPGSHIRLNATHEHNSTTFLNMLATACLPLSKGQPSR